MLLLPFSLSAPIPSSLGHLIKQPLTHHSSTILTPSTSLWPKNPIHSIHPLHCARPLYFLVIIKKKACVMLPIVRIETAQLQICACTKNCTRSVILVFF